MYISKNNSVSRRLFSFSFFPFRLLRKRDILYFIETKLQRTYNHIMPRTARASVGGVCYHVLNRGNSGSRVFRSQVDYKSFVQLLRDAEQRVSLRMLAYCLLPTHFHLVLWPYREGELSTWMQWLLTAHVRRHHQRYQSHGHIWQGRFKAFPVQQDDHLLTVLRYVEQNPLRKTLVDQSEDWVWSSLRGRNGNSSFVRSGPVAVPKKWERVVNRSFSPGELDGLRQSVNRGIPFGSPIWVTRTVKRLGLESSLRSRGRPRKYQKS